MAEAIGLETEPVALIWTDKAPVGATQFKPGRWGCVVSLMAAATRGRVCAFDRQTFGCWGGGVGLGFGNQYESFPGGIECFCGFLSSGNELSEKGRAIAERMRLSGAERIVDDFLHGERYIKDPESTLRFLEALPMRNIPAEFVVFKPLSQTDPERDDVKSVTFFVDPDRLSALVVLANYARPGTENVAMMWAAGCQVVGIQAYAELDRDRPRGLVGMTDISARKNVRASLGEHIMSFTAPWPLFAEMEHNVEGSFLQRETWQSLEKSAS
jgi:uncharacterized protein (DUF169 family)